MKLAIYGKGGIGKSTTASNVIAASTKKNEDISPLLIGCDPKGDSTTSLMNGNRIKPILDYLKEGENIEEKDVVREGYGSVKCVEVGGPEPGVGCAGRGIIVALEELEKTSDVLENSDLSIFDVPGDIVCGGLAMPIRKDFVDMVFIVTSGEYLPLYAANNICKGLKVLDGKLGGIICNSRLQDQEKEKRIVKEFANKLGSKLVSYIPRNQRVQDCEIRGKTVIEAAPSSEMSEKYQHLFEEITNTTDPILPDPISESKLRELVLGENRN